MSFARWGPSNKKYMLQIWPTAVASWSSSVFQWRRALQSISHCFGCVVLLLSQFAASNLAFCIVRWLPSSVSDFLLCVMGVSFPLLWGAHTLHDVLVVGSHFFGPAGFDRGTSPVQCWVCNNGTPGFTVLVWVHQFRIDLMLGMYVLLNCSLCVSVLRYLGISGFGSRGKNLLPRVF